MCNRSLQQWLGSSHCGVTRAADPGVGHSAAAIHSSGTAARTSEVCGPACILRRRPPARPEQKNETDAHPPIGRVSQKGRVGARPALSVVLHTAADNALNKTFGSQIWLADETNIKTVPCWGKNSPENCLLDLGRDTRTRTQSRQFVWKKDTTYNYRASFLCIGRVLSRLDKTGLTFLLHRPLLFSLRRHL